MKKIDFDKYQAILFDFDGIFVLSEHFFYKSCQIVLKEYFNYELFEEEYFQYWTMLGQGMRYQLKRINKQVDENTYRKIEDRRLKLYEEFCKSGEIKFIDETLQALEILLNKNYKIAIASNTPDKYIHHIFESAGIKPKVPIIGKRKGLRGKPHPDIFIYAAGHLDVEPQHCIVIEDTIKGINAAKKVKMDTILVKNQYWNKENDNLLEETVIFENHKSFLDYLQKIFN